MSRRDEALALFATHGVADAVTTWAASSVVGSAGEANPLLRPLMSVSVPLALVVMLAAVGLASLLWYRYAERYRLPTWYAVGVSLVGVLVSVGNLGVAFL